VKRKGGEEERVSRGEGKRRMGRERDYYLKSEEQRIGREKLSHEE
jgi:hypothetical protein